MAVRQAENNKARTVFATVAVASSLLAAACEPSGPPVLILTSDTETAGFAVSELEHVKALMTPSRQPALRVCWRGSAHERIRDFTARHIGQRIEVSIGGETVATPVIRDTFTAVCSHLSVTAGLDADMLAAILRGE